MNDKKREITITTSTKQKVQAAKNFIQQRYSTLIQQQQQKKEYWQELNQKMKMLNMPIQQQQSIKKKIMHQQAENLRQQRIRLSIRQFPSVKIIGKGAFGEVRLCKSMKTGDPVAVKKLKKSEMIFKNKVVQSRQQRNVLAISEKNPWIVGLKCSFQDPQNLYLVMQYLPGGDLMNLLIKKDIFTHQQAQFYTAQILLALDSVHKMKYIHRDLKPDNVLLDADGHIKLSDFGLCKHIEIRPKRLIDAVKKKQSNQNSIEKRNDKSINANRQNFKRNRKMAYSAVGTPDYVAPQVQGKIGYTQTVDWWSMGVILFEMLVGYPPFASDDPSQTWYKIQNWRKYLVIPQQVDVSPQAADLIRKLVCDPKDRLGVNGVQQIKAHPFFAGINWQKLRQKKSPFIPEVKSSWDTDNFDPYQEQEPWIPLQSSMHKKNKKKTTQFIGYTYKPLQEPNSALLKALVDLNSYTGKNRKDKNSLDYLQLQQATTNDITNSSVSFLKKDKNERFYREFPMRAYGATTAYKQSQVLKHDKDFVYQERLERKERQKQKIKVLKKESPLIKQKDDKKLKPKISQKKYF